MENNKKMDPGAKTSIGPETENNELNTPEQTQGLQGQDPTQQDQDITPNDHPEEPEIPGQHGKTHSE